MDGSGRETGWASLRTENARQIARVICGEWKRHGQIRRESGVPSQSLKWYLDRMVKKGVAVRRRAEAGASTLHLNGVAYEYRLKGT